LYTAFGSISAILFVTARAGIAIVPGTRIAVIGARVIVRFSDARKWRAATASSTATSCHVQNSGHAIFDRIPASFEDLQEGGRRSVFAAGNRARGRPPRQRRDGSQCAPSYTRDCATGADGVVVSAKSANEHQDLAVRNRRLRAIRLTTEVRRTRSGQCESFGVRPVTNVRR